MKSRPEIFAWQAVYATVTTVAVLALTACNKAPEPGATVAPSTSVGVEIDDSVITARVKSVLLLDEVVRSFEFKVETRKGEVQLSGYVANQAQIDRAIAITREVRGVRGIDNKVSLKGVATTVGNEVDDGVITTEVKSAMLADANIKSLDISVKTRKGEVQLSGFVDSQVQIDRAITVARGVKGVSGVNNEMSIKK
jgi:hyperosmotically inducible protein